MDQNQLIGMSVVTPATMLDGVASSVDPAMALEGAQLDPASTNNGMEAEHVGSEPAEPTGAVTYNDLFPALPDSGTEDAGTSGPAPQNRWAQMMRGGSSNVTQVFHVPFEDRRSDGCRFGDNSSARVCSEIMQKTSTTIECSTGRDQALTFLVTGKQANIMKAKRLIMERFLTTGSQEVKIPKSHHRFILGRGAARLRELEQATATKIQVPSEGDSSEMVSVSGARDDVDRAIHELKAISDQQAKQSRVTVTVPKKYHPFICGAHNENITRWTSENPGVRVDVPPPSVMQDDIAVAGEKEGVLRVEQQIKALASDMERRCSSLSMQVDKSQHRYVVGVRGSGLADVLQKTGVIVELPSMDSPSNTVTLLGPQEQLSSALSMVYERANSVVCTQIACPAWCRPRIIGKKGAEIKQLTGDLEKVNIEFDSEANQVKIEGAKEDVKEAHARLEKLIMELLSTTTFQQVDVPMRFHKHIIGKSGSVVNRIKTEHGVNIYIPDAQSSTTQIGVEGPKDGVTHACQELLAIAARLEGEKERDIVVDNRYHGQIIGSKGETINQIRQKFPDVVIILPKPNEKSDIIKLRGPKEMVDQCYKHMQKMVKEMEACSFQERVRIFKQNQSVVLRRGAASIRQVQEKTGTRIDLPRVGGGDEATACEVVITGRQKEVEEARRQVEQIVAGLESVVEEEMTIPARFHTSIIGAGGRHIQSIMSECGGVRIQFPSPDSGSDKVSLNGPKDDVEKAKKILLDLANEKVLQSFSVEVHAKPDYHRFLIGKNGSKIESLRSETLTRISFPVDGDKNSEVITIEGRKDNVLKAKEQLEQWIKELDLTVSEVMHVPVQYHRHFVVRRAEVLRQLRQQYGGVEISFPRQGSSSDEVTVKGAAECVQAAVKRVQEIVDSLERQVTVEVEIESRHLGSVMGARGCHVQRITQQYDVQIKFPERARSSADLPAPGSSAGSAAPVQITGLLEQCQLARDELLALVPVTDSVHIPFAYHRFIIGQRGKGVRDLMTRHEVNFTFPPTDQQSDVVSVTGLRENIEEAKQALLERVRELDEERADRELRSFSLQLQVPSEYHSKIIGRGGAIVSKLRQQHDVQIQFGGARDAAADASEADHDTITITGYQRNAEMARDSIRQMVEELENMVREVVTIDSRVHSRIIGSRGKNVRQIMKDFKVDIHFPRGEDNSEPDTVVVSGPNPDDVENCVCHLQCLEEEYMQDVVEREHLNQLVKPSRSVDASGDWRSNGSAGMGSANGGFVVSGAPWQVGGAGDVPPSVSAEHFPCISGGVAVPGSSTAAGSSGPMPAPVVWGPRR